MVDSVNLEPWLRLRIDLVFILLELLAVLALAHASW